MALLIVIGVAMFIPLLVFIGVCELSALAGWVWLIQDMIKFERRVKKYPSSWQKWH